ncbi:MAG TPA: glycosyl amidation-associated protein WbuZ [Candidatus Nanoarchaeia archaeon]|nr:glycosyl amidation-associated protein WbuZ [Candidatus Nanoarchaeia archaeon]
MLKTRLIPVLLLKQGRMVKTIQFDKERDVGNPVTTAKIYNAQNADELVFLDILASVEERDMLIDIINRVTEECFMPLTVGGGVKTLDDIRSLLKAGADKVSINSAAVENPKLIEAAARKFGSANIVASIDFKDVQGAKKAVTHRGTHNTNLDPVAWAKELQALGAGEIFLNNVDADGMMRGYDIQTIRAVSDAVSIPVIACGGAGTLQDFVDAIREGHASAVAAGSIFHFTDQSPIKARRFMHTAGLNVRMG